MTPHQKLRELALCARDNPLDESADGYAFRNAACPSTVIALLDEIERLRAAWDRGVAKMTKATYAQVSLVTERLHFVEAQLAAMTAARDGACDLAVEHAAYTRRDALDNRIVALRRVGGGE
jgi:hypothetical protein